MLLLSYVLLCFIAAKKQSKLSKMFVQAGEGQAEVNGLQISNAFSLNPDCSPGCPTASFNPGRGSGSAGQLAQNGDMGSHNRAGDELCCKTN